MIQSLSMLGVFVAGIGGFIIIAGWDTGRHHGKGDILAYLLVGTGVALFVAGIIQ